jgi:plasmid maintenance system killer protein
MIRSFQHKGLAKLWNEDDPRGVRADLLDRVRARLTALNEAQAARAEHARMETPPASR